MLRDFLAGGIGAALAAILLLGLQPLVAGVGHTPKPAGARPSAAAEPVTAAMPSEGSDQAAWKEANANLAQQVQATEQRLARNEAERRELESELKAVKAKVAAAEGDGGPVRNEYDLTQEDWKELAKTGSIRARYPCRFTPDWHVDPRTANHLGLSPSDVAAVEAAYTNEEDRLAGIIHSGCVQVLGNAELARRLGTTVCTSVVLESAKDARTDLQLVANIRAGNVAMPPAGSLDPYAAMILAETQSEDALQKALTSSFAPDDAHRLAFAEELGSCSSSMGEPPPSAKR